MLEKQKMGDLLANYIPDDKVLVPSALINLYWTHWLYQQAIMQPRSIYLASSFSTARSSEKRKWIAESNIVE